MSHGQTIEVTSVESATRDQVELTFDDTTTTATQGSIASRCENARLRMRIESLERALEARERDRQQLIRQYELVLSDLECELERERSGSSPGPLARLVDWIGFD